MKSPPSGICRTEDATRRISLQDRLCKEIEKAPLLLLITKKRSPAATGDSREIHHLRRRLRRIHLLLAEAVLFRNGISLHPEKADNTKAGRQRNRKHIDRCNHETDYRNGDNRILISIALERTRNTE